MKKALLLFISLTGLLPLLSPSFVTQGMGQVPEDKKIGLTLSGGGARGMAHVGILHVIDSLGLRIDYISGTSMGSIVGGMYASGYTAAEIEEFALGIDWESMFSRRSDLAFIHPSRRDDYQKYIIELPIEGRRIRTATGAIEGQQLWNTLGEVFLHTYHIDDFNKLDIPFACVATNVENGEAVVMREGNLVTAIRASMAIPSVFTAVERDGLKLIDGGVVNNYPTNVAKEMGAGFIIGVNVSQGLRPAEELVTPIDIIYQMGFYSDARNFVINREITDLFMEPDLEGFTAASFAHTAELIERGKQEARRMIPELMQLPVKSGKHEAGILAAREELRFVVEEIEFHGLENVREWFVNNTIHIEPGDTIDPSRLTRAVNRLYASNYFNRVHFHLRGSPTKDHVVLVLEMDEKPFNHLAAGLHFSSFTGLGIKANVSSNRFFLYNAEAQATIMIGEQPAFRTQAKYFLEDRRRRWIQWEAKGRRFNFPLYEDFDVVGEYRQGNMRMKLSASNLLGENGFVSIYQSVERKSLRPEMRMPAQIDASIRSLQTGIGYSFHSLNHNDFATSGQRIRLNARFIHGQRASVNEISRDGKPSSLDELGIDINNFFQFSASFESYVPIFGKLTQINHFQLGYHLNYNQSFIHGFNLGGTYPFLYNQLSFYGLSEYNLISESILAAGLGYRYDLGRGIFATGVFNAALYDFAFNKPELVSSDNFILGGGLSLGYDGLVGPFEVTFSYSPQTGNVIGYINLGWFF